MKNRRFETQKELLTALVEGKVIQHYSKKTMLQIVGKEEGLYSVGCTKEVCCSNDYNSSTLDED